VLLSAASDDQIRRILQGVRMDVHERRSVESAAQTLASSVFEALIDSIVLARVFVTVPLGECPASIRRSVDGVEEVDPVTPLLVLLGTRGRRPEWNSRHQSRGHAAIPLISRERVGEVPMIARLLAELGVSVEGLQRGASGVETRTIGTLTGTFYVEDAATALDDRERPIIGARDFVEKEGVKTVFGCGGAYLREQSFAVVVLFLSERVPRLTVERLGSLGSVFKTATMRLMAEKRIFTSSPAPGA
jgi:hypothetical protein